MKTLAKQFAFMAMVFSLLLSCSLPGWVPFFGEDEKENSSDEQETLYNYCVFVSAGICLSGSFSECIGGGILSNNCPFNSSDNPSPNGQSSSSNNGNPGNEQKPSYDYCLFNGICLEGPFSECGGGGILSNNCPFQSSSSAYAPPPPSSSSVSSSSSVARSSSSAVKYYCDCGPISSIDRFETGGGCFQMESQYGDCDLDWCKVATSCGRTDLSFCDYGPWEQYRDGDGYLQWGGGCFRITGDPCDTQWATIRSTCPWLN